MGYIKMDLPSELLWQILLPLSYEEIMSYCQTNQEAYSICVSHTFWNLKALQDFNQPLDTIVANTPALQYKIMSEIKTSQKRLLDLYILYQQPQLIKRLSWYELNQPIGNASLDAMFKQMTEGNWSALQAIKSAEFETIYYSEIVTDLYMYAVLNKYFDVAAQLTATGEVLLEDTIWEIAYEADLESFKFLAEDAAKYGHPNLFREYADNGISLSLESPDTSVAVDAEILKYALDQTYTKADLRELVQHVIQFSPTLLGFLVNNYFEAFC